MNDQDKIALMNHIIALARPVAADELKIDSLDAELKDSGLDSLDFLMVGIYLGDVYGMSEEDLKNMQPAGPEDKQLMTVRDMFDYAEQHSTKTPATLEEAVDSIL